MLVEGTRQAFEALINERGIHKKLGVGRSTVSMWKMYLMINRHITLDKMEEMLIKSGATVAQDKVWDIVQPK